MSAEMAKKQGEERLSHPERARGGRAFLPNVDIIEKGDEILVLADVPGAKPDCVNVTYENGVLDIQAPVEPRQDPAKTVYLLQEYAVGDYHRTFRLGQYIDPTNIQAEMKDGVLTLHLPKAEPAKRKQIEVKTA